MCAEGMFLWRVGGWVRGEGVGRGEGDLLGKCAFSHLKTLKFGPIIISCDGMFFVCSRFFVVVFFFVMSLACACQLRHCVPISFRCCVCLCLPCFDMYI